MSAMKHSDHFRSSHAEILREIARYMEVGLGSPQPVGRCGSRREGPATCTCFRHHEHGGEHRCVCGSVWADG